MLEFFVSLVSVFCFSVTKMFSASVHFCNLLFFPFLSGDLLENYCIDDTLVNVARVGYAFVVMFTFPIEMFVCREVSGFVPVVVTVISLGQLIGLLVC